jgi:DNA repair exonuclease SbcCD ATPase subunit
LEKLSLRKQLLVVRLYLSGLSYDEIAAKGGVSKGTVANIVSELKAGRFPDASDVSEQLELLRELAVELKQTGLTPGRAAVGVAVLSHLQEFGLEPADVERWATLSHSLTSDTEARAFTKAAMTLEEVRKRTGLSIDALEKKALELAHEVERLEPLAQQVRQCQQQLEGLEKQRQRLGDEVSELERRLPLLHRNVEQKEKREAELSRRVQELEQRAQGTDERLTVARKDLQVLAGLGFPLDDLSGFVQRLCGIAQRHGIQPEALRERLLHELEQLEEGLGLETLVEMKRQELAKAKQALAKAQERLAALEAATQQLRQEQAALYALVTEERKHISKETQAITLLAKEAVADLKGNLRKGMDEALVEVQRLRNQTLELGKELGHFQAVVESNQWLQELLALVKGNSQISSGQVRVIGLVVLRGILVWLKNHPNDIPLSQLLISKVSAATEEMERWKV